MEIKVIKDGKVLPGNLFISLEGDVLVYGKDKTYLCPTPYNGTLKGFIQEHGVNISGWASVETGNPYGSYEENCNLHALGLIDMDDPYHCMFQTKNKGLIEG